MPDLASIRKEYAHAQLDEKSMARDPLTQFQNWLAQALAADLPEPTAMNLATVSSHGRPSARTVLLKGVTETGFCFYTNYQSQKGRELDDHPFCALTFFWPELERQVRVEGTVARLSEQASEAYFQSRPRASQVGAWVSPQSTPLADRSILEQRLAEIEKRFAGVDPLPKPRQWGGYEVKPLRVEFWQGRPSRLHDRIVYQRSETGWSVFRLAP